MNDAPPVDIEAVKNIIRTHAKACEPNECCGLIIKKGEKQDVICCRNIAEKPRHSFMLHPEDYQKAEEAGEILALYHSHCYEPPEASPNDKTMAEKHGLAVITVSWPADSWDVYMPSGWKADLVGRPFVLGALDCLTLVKDYYKEKHGIELPDFEYTPNFWNKGQNLFVDNLPKNDFVMVDDLQPDDILIMQLESKLPNHCAIYTGDGMILHHPPGQLSGYHPYLSEQGFYARATVSKWRHKKLIQQPSDDFAGRSAKPWETKELAST